MTRPRRRALAILGLALLCIGVAWLGTARDWPIDDTWLGVLAGFGAGGVFAALLLWWMPDSCDVGTPALRSRYMREFMPAMAAYVITLFASVWMLKHVDEPGLRALVALLPVPAIAMAMRAIVRYIRDADELQRRIELEAVSIATAFVSLGYLAAGFLQAAKVVDIPASAAMIWVFPLVCLVYGIAKAAVSRRYG
jgi:hypothetical protein